MTGSPQLGFCDDRIVGAAGGVQTADIGIDQSSVPVKESVAAKNTFVPAMVMSAGPATPMLKGARPGCDDRIPGLMSWTRTLPAAVPSLRQSSEPCTPSLASKRRVPPTFKSESGFDPTEPGHMSLTS